VNSIPGGDKHLETEWGELREFVGKALLVERQRAAIISV
jgi:hypothetical protein